MAKKTEFTKYILPNGNAVWVADSISVFELTESGVYLDLAKKTRESIKIDLSKYKKYRADFSNKFSFHQHICNIFSSPNRVQ